MNNYRVMKFLEPVDKKGKCKGYVRLDLRGQRGLIIVSVENIGDSKSTSDIFLYKNRNEKIKLGTVNNRKGMIKKTITFGPNTNINDYNVCGVVNDGKIVLYSNLYNKVEVNDIRKLEETVTSLEENEVEEIKDEGKIDEVEKVDNPVNEKKDIEKISKVKSKLSIVDKPEVSKKYEPVEQLETTEELESKETEIPEKQEHKEEIEVGNKQEDAKMDEDNNIEDVHKPENEDVNVESAARKNKPVNKFEQRLYNTLGEENKIEPLSVKIKNLTWWRIPYSAKEVRSGVLPFYSQVLNSYYPFPMANRVTTCHNLIKKYGHYLFGVYKENDNITRFVYGVPGEFKREEQPYRGVTGFKNWSYKNKNIDGNFGYWVVFVNATTGEITEPPQNIK